MNNPKSVNTLCKQNLSNIFGIAFCWSTKLNTTRKVPLFKTFLNAGKYGQEKLRIGTLFTHCTCINILWLLNGNERHSSARDSSILTHSSLVFYIIQKPVVWFVLQITWLVSIWNATLGRNRLNSTNKFIIAISYWSKPRKYQISKYWQRSNLKVHKILI